MRKRKQNPWLCDQPLIVALDGLSVEQMWSICEDLHGLVSVVSLNTGTLLLHPHIVKDLRSLDIRVFADVMLYAPPKTMAIQMAALSGYGVRYVTVSIHSGEDARRAAVRAKEGMCVLYTAALSSMSAAEFHQTYGGNLDRFQRMCLERAVAEKADGVLMPASSLTTPLFTPPPMPTQVIPDSEDLVIVAAGVRPQGWIEPGRDRYHVATTTPRMAILNGASHVDMGQPIVKASSPRAVVEAVYEEIGFDPTYCAFIPERSAYRR